MKKIFILFTAVLFTCNVLAQKISSDNVPVAVVTAFKAKFSIAEKTTWEMDYDNYQADFIVGKSEFSAKFDKEGKWLETATYLKISELPKAIKDALSKKYGELSAFKVESPIKVESEKSTVYAMDIIKGESAYELVYDEAGELLEDDVKATKKD